VWTVALTGQTDSHGALPHCWQATGMAGMAPRAREDPAAVVVNHIANKHIAHLERKRQAAEFDVPVDDLPVGRSAKKEKSKSQVPSPDAFLESQRKAARIQQEPSVPFDEEPISGSTVIPSAHQEEFEARAVSEEELLEFTPEADADIAQAVMQAVAPMPEEPALEKVSAKDARASAQMVAQEIAENAQVARSSANLVAWALATAPRHVSLTPFTWNKAWPRWTRTSAPAA